MSTGQQTRDTLLVPPDPKPQALPELRGLPRVPVKPRRRPKRAGCARAEPIRAWEVTQDVRAYVRACALAHGSGGGAERPEPETELGSGPGRGRCERRRADPGGRGRSPGGRDWSRARERGGRSQGPGLGGGAALRRRGGAGTPAAVPPPSRTSCGTSARASPPER